MLANIGVIVAAVGSVIAAFLGARNHANLTTLAINIDGRMEQLLNQTKQTAIAETRVESAHTLGAMEHARDVAETTVAELKANGGSNPPA